MKILPQTPNNAVLDELGRRLAQFRKAQGMSQDTLATAAGIGVATLRRIEAGQDSQMESWLKLLKALNMTTAVDELLPESFESPMAEVLSERNRKRRRKTVAAGPVWGDEIE